MRPLHYTTALAAFVTFSATSFAASAAKSPKAPPKPAPPMAFNPKELDLAPGETYRVELFVPSPTGKDFKGALKYEPGKGVSVKPDPRWKDAVPGYGQKTYPTVTAAPDADGEVPLKASLEKGGTANLTVRVAKPQVELVPGVKKLTVKVTNPFKGRKMTGRIQASNPDRFLQDVTAREFNVPAGQSQELVFPLPGAAPAEGEKYDFTLTIQTYQGYHGKVTESLAFPRE